MRDSEWRWSFAICNAEFWEVWRLFQGVDGVVYNWAADGCVDGNNSVSIFVPTSPGDRFQHDVFGLQFVFRAS